MKIETSKDALLKSVMIADSIVSTKAVNAILMNCLFRVFSDEIEIMATDNEIGIRTKVPASADVEGAFCVSGKRFASIVRELPDGVIELTVNDRHVIDIRSQSGKVSGRYSVIGTSGETYPDVPTFGDEDCIEIDQAVFKRMLRRVMYAASTDTVKAVFNGVYMVSEQTGSIATVASDSRRLAMTSAKIGGSSAVAEGIILPLKAAREVYALLGNEGSCRAFIGKNQCFFRVGNTEVVSRVIGGQFPNYQQVIPREHLLRVTIKRDFFLESLRRAINFTVDPVNKVVLFFDAGRMRIEAKSPDFGESEEELAITSNGGEAIEIGVNAHFLIDALKEIETDVVRIGITGQKSPMTLAPDSDETYVSVIMPLTVKSA